MKSTARQVITTGLFILFLLCSSLWARGNKGVTRIEMARLIDRLLTSAGKSPKLIGLPKKISDVSPADARVAEVAMTTKLLMPYQGKFSPNKTINRFQMAVLLNKLADYLGLSKNADSRAQPKDVNSNHWASKAILRVRTLGLMSGDSRFNGAKPMSITDLKISSNRVAERGNFIKNWQTCSKAAGGVSAMLKKAAPTPKAMSKSVIATGTSTNKDSASFAKFEAEKEENDSFPTAMQLPLNANIRGTWHFYDQKDLFRVNLNKPGFLTIQLGGQAPEVKLQLIILGFGKYPEDCLKFYESEEGGMLAAEVAAPRKLGYLQVRVANVSAAKTFEDLGLIRCGSAKRWHSLPRKKGNANPQYPKSKDGMPIEGPITYKLMTRFRPALPSEKIPFRKSKQLKPPLKLFNESLKTTSALNTVQRPASGPLSLTVKHSLSNFINKPGLLRAHIGQSYRFEAIISGLPKGHGAVRYEWSTASKKLVAGNSLTKKYMGTIGNPSGASAPPRPTITGANAKTCSVVFMGRGFSELSLRAYPPGSSSALVWKCQVQGHY